MSKIYRVTYPDFVTETRHQTRGPMISLEVKKFLWLDITAENDEEALKIAEKHFETADIQGFDLAEHRQVIAKNNPNWSGYK